MERDILARARRWIGRPVYAVRRDGTVVTGVLHAVKRDRLILSQGRNAKKARTSGIFTPLVLYDLLAIGLYTPFGFGRPFPIAFDGFWWW